ncbi:MULTISPECIES: hypothetical protein [Streptomyces]|jgi:hypothetical protein|uniref:hypothetical protein n=1 Tax=Streptomyces TaxID=1883 RepID=UPI0013DE52C7|nr:MULTISPECIES: hypothetical protein [Streptomyces]MCF2537817.1 hypothetical protein [Streptomyces sp. FB2]
MLAWIRGALARSTARHLAGVQFCDSCAAVCDAACRADARRRSTHLALTTLR